MHGERGPASALSPEPAPGSRPSKGWRAGEAVYRQRRRARRVHRSAGGGADSRFFDKASGFNLTGKNTPLYLGYTFFK